MRSQRLRESTPIEINQQFKQTEWPKIFGRWAVITQGSEVPQKELFKQWQDQINGLDPLFVDGRPARVNSQGRALLTAMGLVQVRKLPLRDKLGFALFAPEHAQYDTFANRVEFTQPGLALLTDPVQPAPSQTLLDPSTRALPESV
jgi:hypothetical protein